MGFYVLYRLKVVYNLKVKEKGYVVAPPFIYFFHIEI